MANTNIRSRQIKDGDVLRADVNTSTSGSALITKVIAGTGISISSTGADAGTGDVTIAVNATLHDLSDVVISSASSGQILSFNGTNWVNSTSSGTTGDMNSSFSSGTGGTTIAATETSIGTVSITPQSSTSKIQVIARMVATKDSGTTRRTVTCRVKRSTTQVGQDCAIYSQNVTATLFGPAIIDVIDTHGSSSQITYTLYALCDSASGATSERWEMSAIELLGPSGSGGAGVTDGDKGDITVSASGATWTIDNATVSYAKIQNVSANSFLANATGSSATVAEVATNRIPLFSSAITGTPSSSTYLRGDGTWGSPSGNGTVTSVAFTAPTNMSLTGSPITSSGTLALSFSSGYQAEDSTENDFALISSFKTLYNY